MAFKDKLNEIFGIGAATVAVPQEKPRDVIELTPIDQFRNNVRAKLDNIKSNALMAPGADAGQPIAPQAPSAPSCGDQPTMMTERDKEIGLDVLKGSIIKMGPQKVGEVIGKLSAEKKEVDKATGIATSEFDKFVGGLKQEAAEAILGSQATPSATPSATPEAGAAPGVPGEGPKEPQEKLADLVQTKL